MSAEQIENTENTQGQKRKNSDDDEIPRFRTKCLRKKKEKRQLLNDRLDFFEKQKEGYGDISIEADVSTNTNPRVSDDDNFASNDNNTSDDDYDSVDFDLQRELNLATGDIDAIPRLFQPVFHNIENNYGPNFSVFFENEEKLPKALCRYAEECADAWEQLTTAFDEFSEKTRLLVESFEKFEDKIH